MERVHYMNATPYLFGLYTNKANLVSIFHPLAIFLDSRKASVKKVLRWAVRLSAYNYTCIHIRSSQNVWADMLVRWSKPETNCRPVTILMLLSASADDFTWSNVDAAKSEQE